MNWYEEKQARRRERYEELADKNKDEAKSLWDRGSRMADAIPFGQPILVGHHSEKRDRNYRNRIHGTFSRAAATEDKAKYYAGRAASVGKGGISSDDPDAVQKLRAEVQKLEELQRGMIAINKLVRKNDRAGLLARGLDAEQVEGLFKPDFCGRIGFPDYMTQNNNANIRRIKQRIEQLSQKATEPARETITGEGFEIREDREENRVLVVFDQIPPEEARKRLKSSGFKWSRERGAWCRMLNSSAWYAARYALKVPDNQPSPATEEGETNG